VLTVGAIAAWLVSYANNRRYVDEVAQRVGTVRQLVQSTPNRASPDLLPILPRWPRRAASPAPATRSRGSSAFASTRGPSSTAPRAAATSACSPTRCCRASACASKSSCARRATRPQTQYEALKTYLMLHDVQHFDPEALKSYLAADWDSQFGRSLTAEEREQLDTHLNALLAQGAAVSPLAEDKAVVEFHRSRLAAVPLPQRIYDRMRQQGLGKDFPEFTIVRAAGNNAALVFTRPSGQPLTKGVPGTLHLRRLPQGVPEGGDQRRAAARRRADLGARGDRAEERRGRSDPRRRAAPRRGAAHLPERIRLALGRVHRRHPPRADERRADAADPDRAPHLVGRQPAATADARHGARDDAALA
jgi:hypothetical protein